jgi:hypothetical protein
MLMGGHGGGGFEAASNSLALGSGSDGGGIGVISNAGFHLGSLALWSSVDGNGMQLTVLRRMEQGVVIVGLPISATSNLLRGTM